LNLLPFNAQMKLTNRALFVGALLAVGLVIIGFIAFGIFQPGVLNKSWLNWDAIHYYVIASEGYYPVENCQLTNTCNVAFYPLFPLMWRLSHLGPLGVSALNYFTFLAVLLFALRKQGWPLKYGLFAVSLSPFHQKRKTMCGAMARYRC